MGVCLCISRNYLSSVSMITNLSELSMTQTAFCGTHTLGLLALLYTAALGGNHRYMDGERWVDVLLSYFSRTLRNCDNSFTLFLVLYVKLHKSRK